MLESTALNMKVSESARAAIRDRISSSDLKDPVPGLLFGGPGGSRTYTWTIGMYERSQLKEIEKGTLEHGHPAHFVVDGVELIFWQFHLRAEIDGKTLHYDDKRRFFVA